MRRVSSSSTRLMPSRPNDSTRRRALIARCNVFCWSCSTRWTVSTRGGLMLNLELRVLNRGGQAQTHKACQPYQPCQPLPYPYPYPYLYPTRIHISHASHTHHAHGPFCPASPRCATLRNAAPPPPPPPLSPATASSVNVKVIMATNRADTLDPALLRPGRLDRKIEFPNPDRRQKRMVLQACWFVRAIPRQKRCPQKQCNYPATATRHHIINTTYHNATLRITQRNATHHITHKQHLQIKLDNERG
mmetsp:Transcript_71694/g.202719  ORF Transcript_71694/g.202719 Transcript_71694/m.202719 type:complete len:247 (+) Transcript_71694:805-1545(+)